jgi:hypothetical protein
MLACPRITEGYFTSESSAASWGLYLGEGHGWPALILWNFQQVQSGEWAAKSGLHEKAPEMSLICSRFLCWSTCNLEHLEALSTPSPVGILGTLWFLKGHSKLWQTYSWESHSEKLFQSSLPVGPPNILERYKSICLSRGRDQNHV